MRPIRVGVIGLGRGATLTVPALLAHPRIAVVAGADPDPAAREGFALHTGAATTHDVATLFADPGIDAVYIASPHEHHADHAIAAARAGKHALVEKPMAVRLCDARAMIAAADAAGTTLLIGPSHGYDPPVTLAAEQIAGVAGPARLIQSTNFTDFLDRPRRPAELDRLQGGGVVFSQASHQIDVARRLAGHPVTRVRGWVDGWHPVRDSDGAFTAMLWFANGSVASLTYSGHGRLDSDAGFDWVGEMGQQRGPGEKRCGWEDDRTGKTSRGFAGVAPVAAAARYHERFGAVIVACRDADLEITSTGVIVHDAAGPRDCPAPLPPVQRYAVADALVRAVLDGERIGLDGRWGLETLACCHALIRSSDEERDVSPTELINALENHR